MTNTEIGNRIKYARDLRDVTLDDIAKKVGVAKSTIQRYETGKITTIKIPVVESIAIALNVNPAWIVGKSEEMELPSQKVPKIMQYYDQLNDIGKHEATKRVEEMTHAPQYMKEDTDYLAVKAAHNDAEITDAELEKMERDSALIVEMVKKKKQ
ncbi:MAG: helix-turn-helix transcriptional regulator [Lachnospiraceae bacterium]|nr:helix-turn-helix transcriptional regulator [Lachnospiraceae bacterium]